MIGMKCWLIFNGMDIGLDSFGNIALNLKNYIGKKYKPSNYIITAPSNAISDNMPSAPSNTFYQNMPLPSAPSN